MKVRSLVKQPSLEITVVLTTGCIINTFSQMPAGHTCNPSYLGDRDEEDHGGKPAKQVVHKTLS
jgi:hypothetical protein